MSYGGKLIGPLAQSGERYHLSAHGYLVPKCEVYKPGHDGESECTLVLDRRFAIDCSEAELEKWAWMLGTAMALGAGYCAFGEHAEPMNLFRCQVHELGAAEPPPIRLVTNDEGGDEDA